MEPKQFVKLLSVFTLIVVSLIFVLNLFIPLFKEHQALSWGSCGIFTILSILMYQLGLAATKSKNQNTFTVLIIVFTTLRLFLSILIVFIYYYFTLPYSKYFILPFFLVYLLYTIFESYFLTKLAKTNTNV